MKNRPTPRNRIPVTNTYIDIFQSCLDPNVVGKGSFHIILKNHAKIPDGFYCRIGFISDNDETSFRSKLEFQIKGRVEWSKSLHKQDFAVVTEQEAIFELTPQIKDSIKSHLEDNDQKKKLRRFYEKHTMNSAGAEKKFIAIYGEMVAAAECDVRVFLDRLDLSRKGDRDVFDKTLDQIYDHIKKYVGFVIQHKNSKKWSSFTFDLKAENALIYVDSSGNKQARLSDLDAEKKNTFYTKSYHKFDKELCELFKEENQTTISLAAFIVLMINSIRYFRLEQWDEHGLLTREEGGHDHPNCTEYRIARKLHSIFEEMQLQPAAYQEKILNLFKVMTGDVFWENSTFQMTYYLGLPRYSAGTKSAWSLSTHQISDTTTTKTDETGLYRRRWLLLLILNIFKCSVCEKPRPWFLKDLVQPLWDSLEIQGESINFKLSLDLLKQKVVEMDINKLKPASWWGRMGLWS